MRNDDTSTPPRRPKRQSDTELRYSRDRTITFTCETCGCDFERSESSSSSVIASGRRVRYCSKQCLYNRNSKIVFSCEWCGEAFQRYPSDVKKAELRGARIRFCSKACDKANKAQGNTQHTCEICEKEFTVWASMRLDSERRGWKRGRFCSVKCRDKSDYQAHLNTRVTVDCLWCGAELTRKRRLLARGNYCDLTCFMEDRRRKALVRYQKPCSVCGEMLVINDGELIPNYAKRLTCSSVCRRIQKNRTRFEGGEPATPYPPDFNKTLRAQIRQRDGFACQECGVLEDGRHHDVHHIDYDQMNSNPKNLITLCLWCHRRTTNPGDKKQEWVRRYQVMSERRGDSAA